MIVLLQCNVGAAQNRAPADYNPYHERAKAPRWLRSHNRRELEPRLGAAGGLATGLGAAERFVHDAADGPGASPALGATAKAAIDLAGGARGSRVAGKYRPDVVVGEYVAGADDHRRAARRCIGIN